MSSPSVARQAEIQQLAKPQHNVSSQSPGETQVDTAIDQASRAQICHILRKLCAHSKAATDMTMNHLVSRHKKPEAPKQTILRSILKKPGSFERNSQHQQQQQQQHQQQQSTPVEPTSTSNETPPSSQMQSQGNAKRKATTQCRNCGVEYNPANVDPLACAFHSGKQEVNTEHEVWDDFDPDVLGDAWTLMEYEEFASGFQWSCCKRDIDKRGCMLGKHHAAPVGEWKRARR
ncbi:hypothetical protein Q7P35_011699 [Cladosporium inversicolor]